MSEKIEEAFEILKRGDYDKAFEILLPIAEDGDADAQFYIGIIYQERAGDEPEYSDDGEYSDAEEPAVTQSNTNVNDNATTMPPTMPPTLPPQMPMERLYDARHGQNYDPKHPPRQGGNSHYLSLSHSLRY